MIITLAVDAMGGDNAPICVFEGASLALSRFLENPENQHNKLIFHFYGDADRLEHILLKFPVLKDHIQIFDSPLSIASDAKLTDIIRIAPQTSLGKAIFSVAHKHADAIVSSGNTGAFMALSKIYLKTFDGMDRPAIPAFFPTINGQSLMLDLGANLECTPKMLFQFALMGRIYFQTILRKTNPTVGILNIGSEATKGNQIRQDAAKLFIEHPKINYIGFIEGNDISKGTVDIIVTDGFSGNIALKSIEGTATFARHVLAEAFKSSLATKFAYLLMKPALKKMQKQLDQRYYNGAAFLGVKGIAVKSHGGSDAMAFSYALEKAIEMVKSSIVQELEVNLKVQGV
jgi:glycerol-3-phosphate acyltransferase PlsX